MLSIIMLFTGCGVSTSQITKGEYNPKIYKEHPKSILVLPAKNTTTSVDATDHFRYTITKPLSEKGYYVFPVHLVDSFFKSENLSETKMIRDIPVQKLKEVSVNEASFSLGKLFEFVSEWEWSFQYKAFCDDYYSEEEKKKKWIIYKWLIRKSPQDCEIWSIWFWTRSYQWEVITYEEWISRRNKDITARNNLITTSCLTENQRIATVDFMYQHWNNSWVKTLANKCNTDAIYQRIVWWRDRYNGKIAVNWKYTYQTWMRDREQLRINLFYKK